MSAPSTRDDPTPAGRRIMALWFPLLPTERILRARLGRAWRSGARREGKGACQPLAVSRRENNTQRIAALDEAAAALGLRPGMGVADARAMHPGLEVIEAESEADRRLLESLADWCDRYTPLVALCGEDGLFLDITGCVHLFGGEQAMLDEVLERLYSQGFRARAGLASTPGMAWAAARFLRPVPIEPGAEAPALAGLPPAALRLEPPACKGLESLGLRTVGALMDTPRGPLVRRFGRLPVMRLDQALGRLEEAVSPRLPVAPLSVERRLAEPVVLEEDIERLLLLLSATLKADLERRDEGARLLQLALFRVDGAVHRLTIGASRPLREPALILKLFREKLKALGGVDADYGFEMVRLAALEAAPFAAEQVDLAGESKADEAGLALFADRVRARLGDRSILQPVMVESHIPERAVVFVPFAGSAEGAPSKGEAHFLSRERPVRLFPHPEPVEVMAEIPEGPPARFRWRRASYRVAGAEGPERIAPEWWQEKEEGETRDYYRVEDDSGRRYWLYREGFYDKGETPPRWFMQGVFA
ncbi:MAG: DNA polymerase Y family protein [Mesorhizobium sp.]|nr:DNA polymerase Y family protein [Mesorhizobium sp.]